MPDVTAKAERTPQTVEQLDRVFENLDKLHGQITDLSGRLGPVLREPEPSKEVATEKAETPVEALAPLADRIRSVAEGIDHAFVNLRALWRRLEV